MRFISTRVHGIIDYLSAATLLLGPRLLNWDARLVAGATVMAVVLTLLSLATRYEMGAVRVIPMRVHLALDALSGLLIASLPFVLFRDIDDSAKAVLIGFGVFEILSGLMTRTQPSLASQDNGPQHTSPSSSR
jgi:hypothetical protein